MQTRLLRCGCRCRDIRARWERRCCWRYAPHVCCHQQQLLQATETLPRRTTRSNQTCVRVIRWRPSVRHAASTSTSAATTSNSTPPVKSNSTQQPLRPSRSPNAASANSTTPSCSTCKSKSAEIPSSASGPTRFSGSAESTRSWGNGVALHLSLESALPMTSTGSLQISVACRSSAEKWFSTELSSYAAA